jgi:hypothetical protein
MSTPARRVWRSGCGCDSRGPEGVGFEGMGFEGVGFEGMEAY